MQHTWIRLFLLLPVLAAGAACAQDDTPGPAPESEAMTPARLGELIQRIDDNAVEEGPSWLFVVDGLETILVYDAAADRMRIMIPINPAEDLPPDEQRRIRGSRAEEARLGCFFG